MRKGKQRVREIERQRKRDNERKSERNRGRLSRRERGGWGELVRKRKGHRCEEIEIRLNTLKWQEID